MGRMVIVVYRPKPGREHELIELVHSHVPILRKIGLATDRSVLAMRADNGDIVEVFEWASKEAIAQAHEHPEVQTLWQQFDEVCTYEPLHHLQQAADLFAEFTPIDL